MTNATAQPKSGEQGEAENPESALRLNFEHIGQALRWLRNQRSQKQREVALTAGITPAMLSAYETGKHRPSLDTVDRLLGALRCDVYDLTHALHTVSGVVLGRQSPVPPLLHGDGRALEMGGSLELEASEQEMLASLMPALVQVLRYVRRA